MPTPKKIELNPSRSIPAKNQPNSIAKNQTAPTPAKPAQKVELTQVEAFDSFVDQAIGNNQVEKGLAEIYQDADGKLVDVQKMDIKKTHGLVYKFVVLLIGILVLVGLGKAGQYYYNLRQAQKSENINFSITADSGLIAGKEFEYVVSYQNLEPVDLKNVTINLTYPANFIYESSTVPASQNNNVWAIDNLPSKRSDEIRIKGRLVGPLGQNMIILGSMNYTPVNFSSVFTKQTSFSNQLTSLGLDLNLNNPTSVLAGDETAITLKYKTQEENYLDNFRVSIVPSDNLIFDKPTSPTSSPGVWLITDASSTEKSLDLKFKFSEKTIDNQKLTVNFEYSPDGQNYYQFLSQEVPFDVMSKNLNLNLIINASNKDQGVDFGQTLNYSIVYANKGQTDMKDIVIMATLEGDQLDWASLNDKNQGALDGNKITWTKTQIDQLSDLAPDSSGTIDFSIKLKPAGQVDPTKTYQVISYARFSVGNASSTDSQSSANASSTPDTATSTPDNLDQSKSNTIINKINSDLNLKEQVRYFNDDNIAVGSGPLPPTVGETTSYKVYWNLSNSLNELNNLYISTILPAYVNWDDKNHTDLGNLQYDNATRKVTWNIGRLPITTYQAEADFNISLTPTDADKNKILVLLPGSTISAIDLTTGAQINKSTTAKTTKLIDDPAVSDDGRVN